MSDGHGDSVRLRLPTPDETNNVYDLQNNKPHMSTFKIRRPLLWCLSHLNNGSRNAAEYSHFDREFASTLDEHKPGKTKMAYHTLHTDVIIRALAVCVALSAVNLVRQKLQYV